MHIDQMFPSNTLRASDLANGDATATIANVVVEKIGDDMKPVVYFHNSEKRLVLNKTNASTISDIHGPDTDLWSGKQITLGHAYTDYAGKQVECVRVRPQIIQQATAAPTPAPVTPQSPPAAAPTTPGTDELNDHIPF